MRLPRLRRPAALASVALLLAGPAWAATHADLQYGADPRQTLDLHVPDGGAPAPVVVFFHGGGFFSGDKRPCAPKVAADLGAEGIAFACVNYRLVPEVRYPEPMLDGARAVQWLRANAGLYGLDPRRVGLFGMSAGAGIAMWVAFRPDMAEPGAADPVLRQSTAVSAVVAANAQATYDPADIKSRLRTSKIPGWLAELYGARSPATLAEPRWKAETAAASPIANMHQGEPPLLVWYAAARGALPPDSPPSAYVHSPAQGEILAAVGEERGVEVTLRTAEDTGGWPGFVAEAVAFFRSHLGA